MNKDEWQEDKVPDEEDIVQIHKSKSTLLKNKNKIPSSSPRPVLEFQPIQLPY